MKSANDVIGAGSPIPRLSAVRPGEGRSVILTWEDQSITKADLSVHLAKFRVFAPLANDAVFDSVLLDEWGWAIYWPTAPGAAIPSDVLKDLPQT